MRKSRFMMDLEGSYGEYGLKDANKQIERIRDDFAKGKLVIEEDGAARWDDPANYLMDDLAEVAEVAGIPGFNREATAKARSEQVDRDIKEYKERMKNYKPSEEELYEMRAAFGEGEEIVDIITG